MASPSSSASRGEKFESDFAALNATIPRDRAREEKDRIIGFYEQKAEEYDGDLESLCSVGPRTVAEKLMALVPEEAKRSKFEVLDVAAGTGRVGLPLKEVGFRCVDALEPSRKMLSVCESKGACRRAFCCLFGPPHSSHLPSSSYDAVTIAGAFAKGHLPVTSTLEEALRVLKPGGYFLNGMILDNIATCDELSTLEPEMDRLEAEGRWKRVERDAGQQYRKGKQALYHTYQKI